MKLTDIMSLEEILPNLQARNKKNVVEELCRAVITQHSKLELNSLMDILVERERLGSTGIGDGIAIPHGKLADLEKMILVFGRSKAGVDFDSLDGKPAHLFFMVLAPENTAGIHLKTLARISRLLKSQSVRRELMNAKDAQDILTIINHYDEDTN